MKTSFDMLNANAEFAARDKAELGEALVATLFDAYEAQMRTLVDAEAAIEATSNVLQQIPTQWTEYVATELKARFDSEVTKRKRRAEAAGEIRYLEHPEMKKLRQLRRMAEGGGGAAASAADEDEEVQMTQELRSFKCPILQADMQPTGPNRPVIATVCNNKRCVFSYKGATSVYSKKGEKCVITGCDVKVKVSDLKDCHEVAESIRRALQDASDEPPTQSQSVD